MTEGTPLPRTFYERDVAVVAEDLLGRLLVRRSGKEISCGWIVEVEAYRGSEDPASHAYRGRTPRNEAMFGPPGRAYVYSIHAKYCLNAIAQPANSPCGILIRAIEPLQGIDRMRVHRGCERLEDLTRGPARLCQALRIDRDFDHWDLTKGNRLWISQLLSETPFTIATSVRIGVSQAKESQLRYFVDGNRFVSGPRRLHTRAKSSLEDSNST